MLDVKAKFPRKYRTDGLNCPSCKQTKKKTNGNATQSPPHNSSIPAESQSHLMADCSAFDDLREKYDLSEDDQVVAYFKEVLSRRDQHEIVEDDDD